MLKETDFESVRAATKSLLYVSPQPCGDIPFIVYHPIFETNIVLLPHDNHPYDILDINDFFIVCEKYDEVMNTQDLVGLYMMIRTPYKLTWLKHVMPYLCIEDLSHYLADAWVMEENPNQDANCSIPFLIKTFKKCDKQLLMTEKDYQVYVNLPEEVEVYRGVAVNRNPKGLSWTATLSKAQWFANRFNNKDKKGYVQKATVNKQNILAYFNTRNEDELVCDIRKTQIEIIEEV